MKAAQILVLIIVILALMNWVRGDYDWVLPKLLPLMGGHKPSLYDVAGVVLIILGLSGLSRLRDRDRENRR